MIVVVRNGVRQVTLRQSEVDVILAALEYHELAWGEESTSALLARLRNL